MRFPKRPAKDSRKRRFLRAAGHSAHSGCPYALGGAPRSRNLRWCPCQLDLCQELLRLAPQTWPQIAPAAPYAPSAPLCPVPSPLREKACTRPCPCPLSKQRRFNPAACVSDSFTSNPATSGPTRKPRPPHHASSGLVTCACSPKPASLSCLASAIPLQRRGSFPLSTHGLFEAPRAASGRSHGSSRGRPLPDGADGDVQGEPCPGKRRRHDEALLVPDPEEAAGCEGGGLRVPGPRHRREAEDFDHGAREQAGTVPGRVRDDPEGVDGQAEAAGRVSQEAAGWGGEEQRGEPWGRVEGMKTWLHLAHCHAE